jgi:hypothetical protein
LTAERNGNKIQALELAGEDRRFLVPSATRLIAVDVDQYF